MPDGIDDIRTGVGNATNIPAELAEMEFSLITDKYEFVTDSGGPRKYREGLGMQRIVRVKATPKTKILCVSCSERTKGQPYGLAGGQQGATAQWVTNLGLPTEPRMKGKDNRLLKDGDSCSASAPGGGGWGNPYERNLEAVLEDVLEEKVFIEAARDEYGVAISTSEQAIDWEETQRLRHTDRHVT